MKRKMNFYTITDESDKRNGGYKHLIQDRELVICRNDKVVLRLNDDEIMLMLKALGIANSDFEKGYSYEIIE